MSNEVEIVVTSKDRTGPGFAAASNQARGFGATLGSVGKIAAGVLSANVVQAGAQAFKDYVSGSVKAASDLGESLNAVGKIFGASQNKILEWGRANAVSYGLSRRAFHELAVPLGAGLKNAGLNMDQVTGNTIKLTERAADMASVFNTDVSEALEAIQAGLRGEADPLERFGVGLSAAKVEAHALAMSGKSVASSLTEQEKMLARVDLIMKQTEATAGDFRGTSDGLANSQRIAAARTEELQAQLGQKLIPVMQRVTQAKLSVVEAVNGRLLPALDSIGAWWSSNGQSITTNLRNAWDGVKLAFGDVRGLISPLISGLSSLSGQAGETGVSAQTFRTIVLAVTGALVAMGVQALIAGAKTAAAWLLAMGPIGWVTAAIIGIAALVIANWDRITAFTRRAWGAVTSTVRGAADSVSSAVRGGVDSAVAWVQSLPGRARAAVGNLGGLLIGAGRSLVDGFINGIQAAFGRVRDTLSRLTRMLPSWKGPPTVDEQILRDAGHRVLDGFNRGLVDRFGNTRRLLGGLTGSLPAVTGAAAGGGMPASRGGVGLNVTFSGNVDGAFATAFMRLVRTGQIQLSTA